MILIIGGAHQGKLEFAINRFSGKEVYHCGLDCLDPKGTDGIIDSIHLLILAQMRAGIDPEDYFTTAIESGNLSDSILICDDISSGVVPIDREMRLWRDTTGRIMGMLSKHADQVFRLFCGIESQIK